ncbi:MAG: hypothetical protein QOE86_625, partial [Solirubrobacteraceae bacterium]|nr:hypothetical protein [Solirubrobacteraceae bacterium]
ANQAAVELVGLGTAADVYAGGVDALRRLADFRDRDGRPVPVEGLPGRRLLRGEDVEPLSVRITTADGTRRWARMQARPLRRADGSVRLAITVIEDLTELTRAAQSQTFLAEASRLLAGSLDYAATLQQVAALAVRGIADWCVIDLASDDGFKRVVVQHADPSRLALAEELALRYPPAKDAPTGSPQVLRTGAPELYREIAHELLAAGAVDAEHLRLIEQVGMRSAMVVPMALRDTVLGAITLITAESGHRYDDEDLAVATDLATRAATAVETARLYEQRSAIAHTLQASLLPPVLPEVTGVECAAVFRAAGDAIEVGGDFYDLFSTSADEWFAVIGDVCGKGSEAAATTGLVRYTVRAAAVRRRSPSMILRWLNEAMLSQEHDLTRFCTLVIVRLDLDPDGGELRATAASGGHPLPRVVRVDGSVEQLGSAGTLIGVTPDIQTSEHVATLASGDALVLFTDGLTEAGAPQRVWSPGDVDAALREAHAGAGGAVDPLVQRLTAAALGPLPREPRDDIAVLGLRKI